MICPATDKVYEAFRLTPFLDVKVVILGSAPDSRKHVSNGLAFSQYPHVKRLSALSSGLLREAASDLGIRMARHGDLSVWAKRGVLLLNTTLTCEEKKPKAHAKLGYEKLAIEAILRLSRNRTGLVFMLFGKDAQEYSALIDERKHCIITADAVGLKRKTKTAFAGSKPFSKANRYLGARKAIDWRNY